MRSLKGILADCDLTQQELADAIGMARSTLCRKIRQRSFKPPEIRKICDYLKIRDPREIYEIFLR